MKSVTVLEPGLQYALLGESEFVTVIDSRNKGIASKIDIEGIGTQI